MKIRELMTRDPVCCRLSDTAQTVASLLRDNNVGALPVVADDGSKHLEGIITDRDLCCAIVARGLSPNTTIETFITRQVVTCRPEQSLDSCERLMQIHQIRRVLIVDQGMRCVGVISQADLARTNRSDQLHRTIAEISKPSQTFELPATA
ncbi:MAG TPA: CBS domain-containing protein [Terriglobales bacterium]|nr:CBS domain-containing protein [Terriglobales bacterium]